MSSSQYALCVKFADVNPAQIIAATRKHKVAILHVENYNSKKDYNNIFDEYPLDIPKGHHLALLFILSNDQSFLTDKDKLASGLEKLDRFLLRK